MYISLKLICRLRSDGSILGYDVFYDECAFLFFEYSYFYTLRVILLNYNSIRVCIQKNRVRRRDELIRVCRCVRNFCISCARQQRSDVGKKETEISVWTVILSHCYLCPPPILYSGAYREW